LALWLLIIILCCQLSNENKLDKSLKEKIGELRRMLEVAQRKERIRDNSERIRSTYGREVRSRQ
jgi:hypothetical protein